MKYDISDLKLQEFTKKKPSTMCPINLDFGHKGKNNLEFLKTKVWTIYKNSWNLGQLSISFN